MKGIQVKSDFEGLEDLLKIDMNRFLDNMKDILIPMLDLGLDKKLKKDLLRSINALKALSGMFELHKLTEFIVDTEEIVIKIFALERKEIANDLLNDMFVIKDQIEALFLYYLNTQNKTFSDEQIKYSKECIAEFKSHYIDYKNKNQAIVAKKSEPNIPIPQVSTADKETHRVLYVDDYVMYFSPISLKSDDTINYKNQFIELIADIKKIQVDLRNTSSVDVAGIQFVESIQSHCKVSGVKYEMIGESELVRLETSLLGVEL